MSLGFEQAGFDVRAAVEIDPIHCAVHEFNFPECKVIPQSVAELSGRDIRHAAGLTSEEIDVVFGGPPCQGFSLIGQRSFEDPRNRLVGEFVRIVSELDAKYFVFENVKGLTVGEHRKFLHELVALFDSVGYEVHLPWQVLDAADFGVPQHRERLILIGCKKGLTAPVYPERTCTPADDWRSPFSLPVGPTALDALDDLPNADDFEELWESDTIRVKRWGKTSNYASQLRCNSAEDWFLGYIREWNPDAMTSSTRTEHTDISRRRFRETQPGTIEPISRFLKLSPSGLSNTLRAGTDGARGAFTSPRPIHYKHDRCVTVREMARLHGYPDWFRFHVTKWHGARQIGNSVPPPLARAIATQVRLALGVEVSRPKRVMQLGDESLLSLELSSASVYFEVERPASRRDRKSGAKKRKQEEIEAERLASLSLVD